MTKNPITKALAAPRQRALAPYCVALGDTQPSMALAVRKEQVPATLNQRRDIRATIQQFEDAIAADPRRAELPRTDHFAPGIYARELFMPKGHIITSLIHNQDSFVFVLYGSAQVVSEQNMGEVITGPCMLRTVEGTKRILRILEDTLWVGVFATDKTDPNELFDELIRDDHLDTLSGD